MTLRAVLFDHDGTLVDSEPVHFRHWLEALSDQPVELTEDLYRDHFAGIPNIGNARWLVDHYPLSIGVEALVMRKESVTRAMLVDSAFPLVAGARGVIDAFAGRGMRMGVVTGAGPEAIQATIRVHDLADQLPVVVSAADVSRNKPAPDGYLLALARLGLSADECLVFEDTETGLQAALAAGMRCCAIRTPYTAGHDFSRATAVFDSLPEAARWVLADPG